MPAHAVGSPGMVVTLLSGFLLKAGYPPAGVGLDDAEARGFAHRDRYAGDGGQGILAAVEVDHLAHVHLVDVVGAEDQHHVWAKDLHQVEVLVNAIGGAPVPAFARAHLRGHDGHEVGVGAARTPGALDMLDQRLRLVLGQHVDGPDPGVVHVRQHEVDDAVASAERNRGFCTVAG